MRKIVLIFSLLAVLALPAMASAQGVGYDPTAAKITTPTQPAPSSHSSLPFTGLDVSLLVVGGLVLLGAGFALRRAQHGGRTA
jgi:hypothetical protein